MSVLSTHAPWAADLPPIMTSVHTTHMRYEVLVPSAMHESESVTDLDRAYLICLDLAEEFGYAEIRHNGHHIADYGNPAAFLG